MKIAWLPIALWAAAAAAEPADHRRTARGERLPDPAPGMVAWWASSGWKIARDLPPPAGPAAPAAAARVALARNEAEAVQLVLRSETNRPNVRLDMTPFTGPGSARLPPGAVEALRVGYVTLAQPTDASGVAGDWPDPLFPLTGSLDLAAGENQPLWVRVTIPRGTPPGLYTGAVRIHARDAPPANLPLRIEVYNFTLPDRATCTTALGMDWAPIERRHGLRNEADRRKVLDAYLRSFSRHRISPYDPAPLDPIRATWPPPPRAGRPAQRPLRVTLDFSAWDRALTRAFDVFHFNSVRVEFPGLGGGNYQESSAPALHGFAAGSPAYEDLLASYGRQLTAHLRAKGWLDKAYVYWFDEPNPEQYDFVKRGFDTLARHAPGLGRMLTEQPEPALYGGPTIWCPILDAFRPDRAAERRAQGETFWWYICCGPKAPYPGEFIDRAGTDLRAWLWQTWQNGVQGILIWETCWWTSSTAYPDETRPQNPYADPMSWTQGYGLAPGTRHPWGNGDGRFLYPPLAAADGRPAAPVVEGPIETVRWDMLRDGIEDYEYLAQLRAALDRPPARLTPARLAALRALLDVPPDISRSLTDYTRDPAPIERRRAELARALESLNPPTPD